VPCQPGKRLKCWRVFVKFDPSFQPQSLNRAARRRAVLLIFVACCCAQPAQANPVKRRPRVSRPASLDVAPSPEVDARVADEIAKAQRILEHLGTDNLVASPYLVSAFYYHEGFLNDFPVDRNSAAPERRIIGQISKLLTADDKARFLRLLHEVWSTSGPPGPERSAEPVAYLAVSGRRSHRYAVDLFAPEGAAVSSVSRGVVVLADGGWNPDDLFSTTSRKGGNAVIVFDPDRNRFYRYCHLSTVKVSPGQFVAAGESIGSVGHTGLNASRAGHGRHLHFEANECIDGRMRALDYQRLRTLLRSWRSPARVARQQL
jgi:murein DD-endopeptidase MepM/ murein hydrolase activator NlpD